MKKRKKANFDYVLQHRFQSRLYILHKEPKADIYNQTTFIFKLNDLDRKGNALEKSNFSLKLMGRDQHKQGRNFLNTWPANLLSYLFQYTHTHTHIHTHTHTYIYVYIYGSANVFACKCVKAPQ